MTLMTIGMNLMVDEILNKECEWNPIQRITFNKTIFCEICDSIKLIEYHNGGETHSFYCPDCQK